jgi:hypothetical protein
VLVISFSLIAAITIAIGTWAISQTISDYLSSTMNERVARDMQLAKTFYDLMLGEIEGITSRLAADPLVVENLKATGSEIGPSRAILKRQIASDLTSLGLGGNHLVAALDADGNILAAQLLTPDNKLLTLNSDGNWMELGIIQKAITSGNALAATEVIPANLLGQVGLDSQAQIDVIDTVRAAQQMFDPREGSAGLAMTSVSPVKSADGQVDGAMVAFHLINNDFTLVDRIKEVAGIDTATIFHGDLRVSTNVMTPESTRAIGTRVSQEVGEVVLQEGKEFVGPAFVVNEDYITRYDPLKNHSGKVIGILYVGARQASFQRLLNNFNQRILLVGIATILLTIIITTPVSRMITDPLNQLYGMCFV